MQKKRDKENEKEENLKRMKIDLIISLISCLQIYIDIERLVEPVTLTFNNFYNYYSLIIDFLAES